MIGKRVSIVNRKGGVGKTTLTLALADTFVGELERPYDPFKPLCVTVDLDPQASLTKALLYDRTAGSALERFESVLRERRTLAHALDDRLNKKQRRIEEYLTHGVGPNGYTYSLLANDSYAWTVERHGIRKHGPEKVMFHLDSILKELSEIYRYVFIDAPPGQTVLAESAIRSSNLILCPTTPDMFSFWGMGSFEEYLNELFANASAERPPARFVFTKFKSRPPKYDPQDRVYELVKQHFGSQTYVKLLREAGADSGLSDRPVALPFDPRLAVRLEGTPKAGKSWPWERVYTRVTQPDLKRLASAVKKELTGG